MAYGLSCCVGYEQMKAITLIGVATLITLILTSWGMMIDDMEENYVNTSISETTSMNTSYLETYNRQAEMEGEYSSLQKDLNALGSDASWYEKISTGASAMFIGFITLPGKILTTMFNLATDGTTILVLMGFPKSIIYLFETLLTTAIIFFLIELIRRYPV